ncbi:hypothetical protein [Lactococcus lactis]|uniref:hypothetical protein n=1 Tax=Lactococcus lactis TaxID=1358 RepID=UPI002891F6A5|nr:hypothetical protein [Lactococcus lactis]MDT2914439.1 hypothetical protein [Lactococcus lactis]MDT2938574.1 hypothetical protein [Lactococcus lactis]
MGLDQYFEIQKKRSEKELEEEIRRIFIDEQPSDQEIENMLYFTSELAYFRKFNALQNYFEKKFNLDNCEKVIMEDYIYEDLLDRTTKVLNAHQQKTQTEAEEIAIKLLPNTEGFFYGSQEYDEYYYEDVEKLIDDLQRMKKMELDDDEDIIYTCWY